MKDYQKLIDLFAGYKPEAFDKYKWQSPHSLIKRITKPFERDKIAKKVAEKRGVPVQQVIQEWELEGAKALEKGNILHSAIENKFIRNMDGVHTTPETSDMLIQYAKNYIDDLSARCITREQLMTFPGTSVFGFMDYLIYSEKEDKLIIVDWKTNKEIDRYNKFENFLFPLSNLDASKANIYSFQINVYQYLMINLFGIMADELHIVWLNENNNNYEVIKSPLMLKEVELVLSNLK